MKTHKIIVNVTQDNIDNGQIKYCEYCPITLAVLDALDTAYPELPDDPIIGTADTYVAFYNYGYEAKLPEEAMQFIRFFDRRMAVEPFSFELEVPV